MRGFCFQFFFHICSGVGLGHNFVFCKCGVSFSEVTSDGIQKPIPLLHLNFLAALQPGREERRAPCPGPWDRRQAWPNLPTGNLAKADVSAAPPLACPTPQACISNAFFSLFRPLPPTIALLGLLPLADKGPDSRHHDFSKV